MTHRRSFLVSVGSALAAAATPVGAQAPYPARPIRLVVPFPPGGGADIAARVIAVPLGEALGQPIIVENKAGADGVIAGESVMKAPADGYTLLFGTATGMSAVFAFRKSVPYDPVADFTPIARMGTFVFFLYVGEDLPAKSVAELLTHVRANPGKLNYGTGSGTGIIASAQLAQVAKLDVVHIPYKGEGPLTTEMLAGRVQWMFAAGGPVLPHVRAGKLRALATLLPNRSSLLPEVPTLAEAGVKLTIDPWGGLFGPAGLPREVVDRLNREMVKVLGRPDIREQLGRLAFDAQGSTPDEFRSFVRDQLGTWKSVAKQAGIQAE